MNSVDYPWIWLYRIILKFWIHKQNLPDDYITKQCLQLSMDMAELNKPSISQKVKMLMW